MCEIDSFLITTGGGAGERDLFYKRKRKDISKLSNFFHWNQFLVVLYNVNICILAF